MLYNRYKDFDFPTTTFEVCENFWYGSPSITNSLLEDLINRTIVYPSRSKQIKWQIKTNKEITLGKYLERYSIIYE